MQPTDVRDLPIGVFDSGLGGLTVVREIRRLLPFETILYLGDNARVPYGTKSPATIERYAANCTRFLVDKGLKLLVVACNTVSAVALPSLETMTEVPVLGVISAGARAVAASSASRIGVIGTQSTVSSRAYPEHIARLNPNCRVFQKPTPLFVPLAEEGWTEGDVPNAVATHYLQSLVEQEIEILLLGCTHYPLLKSAVAVALGNLGSKAAVVDSATIMALDVQALLKEQALETSRKDRSPLTCFVTDLPAAFSEVAGRFLGEKPEKTVPVDII
jgi:glutamate racemase